MKLALDLDESLHNKYHARDKLFDEPLSTFEPTKKDANVPNVNTVPGLDVFYFDCRVLPRYNLEDVVSDMKTKIGLYQKKYGVTVSMEEIEKDTAGPATSEKSEVVTLLAEAIKQVSKARPRIVGIGGQTVGNLFRKKEIPTAVWSTVDDVPHEPNEYSKVKNLLNDTKVFAALPLLASSVDSN
jgi:succinyl-diaminopimelate desuccinylase